MSIRKIIKWTLLVGIVVALALAVVCALVLNRQQGRFEDFRRAHAEAPRRTAERRERLASTTMTLSAIAPRAHPSNTNSTPTQFLRAVNAFITEFQHTEYPSHLNASWVLSHIGMGGMTLVLPASEFPEEGDQGPLSGGPALRAQIAAMAQSAMANPRTSGRHDLKLATASLARTVQPLLDHAADLLLAEWSVQTTSTYYPYYDPFGGTAPLAVLREGLRGDAERAGRLLERMVHADLLLQLESFPGRIPYGSVQRVMLTLAERGGLADADLARTLRLLEAARLDERELADLRAATAMRLEKWIDATGEDYQRIVKDGHPPLMAAAEVGVDRAWRAIFLAQVRPVALAWAGGDRAAYLSISRSVIGRNFAPNVYMRLYPIELAHFNPDPLAAANEDVDMTRLVAAAARYRLARGVWPEGTGELAGYGLSPFPVRGKASAWGVDQLVTTGSLVSRPIFYCARRLPLMPPPWLFVGNDDQAFIDQSRRGSRRRAQPLIVVHAIWPQPEDFPEGFLEALAGKEDRE